MVNLRKCKKYNLKVIIIKRIFELKKLIIQKY